ncbi:MAG: 3-hydroxyacyl-ACP dehydratase FabZ [Desulfohalobiaceae bacterium]|nr:3-hydroxyacyl-ACP dehydratase FabZ [Desulfohalobiaceae bacterium]
MVDLKNEVVGPEILQLLPHRYPFLLVDRIVSFEFEKELVALKNVSSNEPFFQGHFPGFPVMPGVLIVEAMAQAGGLLAIKSSPDISKNKIFLFSGIEKARFRKPVYPGDQLYLYAWHQRHRANLWKMKTEALVNGTLVTEAVLTAAMLDREEVGQ